MIGYEQFAEFAPPASSREERDAWFTEHDVDPVALLTVGREVADFRLSSLEDGAELGSRELVLLMVSMFAFGFELCMRVERGEKPDLTPASE